MAKRNPNTYRAGKRKCRRCNSIWNRLKGERNIICSRCREHCYRCDVLLTESTLYKGDLKSKSLRCKSCNCEVAKLFSESDCARDRRLTKKYGITIIEYEAIMKVQNKVCYICKKSPKEGGRRLAVDHLHSSGERKRNPREIRYRVRGLLCWQCNNAIGKFKDNITSLRRAAKYLEVWPAQAVLKEEKNGKT